ncbi:MAG TPA: hypothetical protein VMS55_04715 [Myxococcota bacterium]|nr:hypothetical protein [Myxococcota bacterium]
MGWFGLILLICVPALYALFWWLDYHWLAERPDPGELPLGVAEDTD